ncbi:unnamed protein product, partial [Plutella xylostella]
ARLAVQGGLIPGLFPPAYFQESSEISKAHLQGSTHGNDLPTVRAQYSTKNICLLNELDRPITKRPRSSNNSILRRLSSGAPRQGHAGQACKPADKSPKSLRFSSERAEVTINPPKEPVVFRRPLGPVEKSKVFTSRQSQRPKGRISEILKTNRIDSRALRSLIGVVNFASFAVPRGRLNYRDLLVFLNSLPEEPSTKLYYLPGEVRVNLIWWYQNCHRVSQIHVPPPTHFLTTDASDQAWAGQLDHIPISGPWTLTEAYLHCNCKEMLAVLKVLQEHGPRLQHSSVLLQCDSKTVVSYIRNEGGTRSLPLLSYTNQIFQILDFNQINLTAYHLPGKYNAHADHLSRHRRPPEWHLLPQCTEMLFKKLGMPLVDLFASETAHVLENYVSLDLNDHRALYHNAFSRTCTSPGVDISTTISDPQGTSSPEPSHWRVPDSLSSLGTRLLESGLEGQSISGTRSQYTIYTAI